MITLSNEPIRTEGQIAAGEPILVQLGGSTFKVNPLTLASYERLEALLKQVLPDSEPGDDKCRDFFARNKVGRRFIIREALSTHHPEFMKDEAVERLTEVVRFSQLSTLTKAFLGGDEPNPKDQPPSSEKL